MDKLLGPMNALLSEWPLHTKESFTFSDCDCESDVAKNGFIAFLYNYSHLAMVNIKGKVTSQSQSQMQSIAQCE